MSTLTSYAGRTIDLLIFQKPTAQGVARIQLSLGGQSQVCTGIQKLVQKITTMLMSEYNENAPQTPYTSFLTAIRTGAVQTDGDVRSYFALAILDIMRYFNANEADTVPLDEQISGVTLLNFNLLPGYLTLNIRVTSMAGDTRQVILPVPVVP